MLPMVRAGTKGRWCQLACVTHLRDMLPEAPAPEDGCNGHSLLRPASGSGLAGEGLSAPLLGTVGGGTLSASVSHTDDFRRQAW